jgi:hypothetical protein
MKRSGIREDNVDSRIPVLAHIRATMLSPTPPAALIAPITAGFPGNSRIALCEP